MTCPQLNLYSAQIYSCPCSRHRASINLPLLPASQTEIQMKLIWTWRYSNTSNVKTQANNKITLLSFIFPFSLFQIFFSSFLLLTKFFSSSAHYYDWKIKKRTWLDFVILLSPGVLLMVAKLWLGDELDWMVRKRAAFYTYAEKGNGNAAEKQPHSTSSLVNYNWPSPQASSSDLNMMDIYSWLQTVLMLWEYVVSNNEIS